VVLDESFGCRADSQFVLFSAGSRSSPSPCTCSQGGGLSLDDPVAARWPEFGQRGKQAITIRQVLQHRGGLPVARDMPLDALAMTDWDASVRAIERAVPAYPPGEVVVYHILTFGFILGEVVRRVTSVGVREFVAGELLGPLGVTDVYLGLPPALWARHVPVGGRLAAECNTRLVINRRAKREAGHPGRERVGHRSWPGRALPGAVVRRAGRAVGRDDRSGHPTVQRRRDRQIFASADPLVARVPARRRAARQHAGRGRLRPDGLAG
jgi:CubicO group peptidase (beta-lactamase class C family)